MKTLLLYASDCPSESGGDTMFMIHLCEECGLEFKGKDVPGYDPVCPRCELEALKASINQLKNANGQNGVCVWTLTDKDTDTWKGACGVSMMLLDSTPEQMGYHYCPECSKPIFEVIPCVRKADKKDA